MIEIGISQFFTIVLVSAALLAGLTSAWDRLHERWAAKAVRKKTVRCRICGAVFQRVRSGPIQCCPECKSANQSGRDRRLG